jgi:copper chaperone NosL
MSRALVTAVGLFVLALAGCTNDGPPTVRYGHEECAHCRMIVNDERFAAAVATPAGETRKFDEVCCLVEFLKDHPGEAGKLWVRSYQPAGWLDARTAVYVHGPKLQTPMGSGLAAVADRPQADTLAAELGGKVLRFDELADFLARQAEADAAGLPGGRPKDPPK